MAGLCRSIIRNVFTKVVRISNSAMLGKQVVVQGGTFKNDAVLCALEQYLGQPVTRAPYPGEMGAIGAGLSVQQTGRCAVPVLRQPLQQNHSPVFKRQFVYHGQSL